MKYNEETIKNGSQWSIKFYWVNKGRTKCKSWINLKCWRFIILNDIIQDLGEIICIMLIIKIVGTRVAIWEKSIPVIKMEQ